MLAHAAAAATALFEFGTVAARLVRIAEGIDFRLGMRMEGGVVAGPAQLETDGAVAVREGLVGRQRVRSGEVGSGVEEGDGIESGRGPLPVEVREGQIAIGGDGAVFVEGDLVHLLRVPRGYRAPGSGIRRTGIRRWGGRRWERRKAGGARQRGDHELKGIERGASAVEVEFMGEEAVDDLGGDELDGGMVFEEGNGDVGGMGKLGLAVTRVGEAEVGAIEGIAFAALARGGEGSATGRGLGLRVGDYGLRVPGTGLRVGVYGLRVPGTGLRVGVYGLRVGVYGLRVGVYGLRVGDGFRHGSSWFGVQRSAFGVRKGRALCAFSHAMKKPHRVR
jgi:hypothetical protein